MAEQAAHCRIWLFQIMRPGLRLGRGACPRCPAGRAARRSVPDVLNPISMSGLDWSRIDQPLFDHIVDTILGRMFGERGFAPEGRGGDEGIDYTVDDNTIIFQHKFFPDGTNTSSRRRQIKRSFTAAMAHEPKEWVIVIPAKLLPAMRDYVLGGRATNPTKTSET
jgi:hypothetical protein